MLTENVKRYTIAMVMMTLLGVLGAQDLTTNDISGRWNIAIVTTNQVPVFGDVSWRSIAIASNEVAWTWVRDSKIEKHKGSFVIIPETPTKDGMRAAFTIKISPTTMAVPSLILLRDVIYNLDNRFRHGTMVLKFQDENDNWHVFLRNQD